MKGLKTILSVLLLVLIATNINAQSQGDAIELYNNGLSEAQAQEYESAITTFERVISIANQLGPEGEEVLENAQNQLLRAYYNLAVSDYETFQSERSIPSIEATINSFRDLQQVSEEYGNSSYKDRADRVIPQLHYAKASLHYSEDELELSEEEVDRALNLNSNYAAAYFLKARIFKKVNDTEGDGIIDQNIDQMLEWFDRAIQVANSTGQTNVATRAQEAAHDELLAVGANAINNENYRDAILNLERALDYNSESADVYFRLAEANNGTGNPEQALSYATTALEYENGGRTDLARIYFELGYAHQTLGNNAEACEAFSEAVYGNFKDNAEYIMEHELKCESSTP